MSSQIERGFKIIEALAESGNLEIDELYETTKIPRSTIFKLLKIMEGMGYVSAEKKNAHSDRWFLTLKMLKVSRLILSRLDLKDKIRDVLAELSKQVGEIVQLGILNHGKVMYIDIVKKPDSIISYAGIGKELDINISAAGMVMASALEKRELSELLNNSKFPKNTQYTITEPRAIKKELEIVARNGYAYDDQQYAIGVRCLAAPIYNFEQKVIAAINITGHISTISDERIEFFKQRLMDAALKASRRMGYENDTLKRY